MKKIILSILCAFMFFSLATGSLTAYAAPKNTVTTSVSKVESKAKSFKVTWKKKSKINGYQIQYSTSSKFKKKETKTKTITKAKTTSATVSKLKGCNIKYYVRVRTYKVVNGKKNYSSWSKTKSVTTLKHKYSKATCTKAKTCKYCDKTSGKKLGHKWSAATCTKAKTCSRCSKTSGEALGHKWSVATCTKAKTCSRCKKTSGEALGHSYKNFICTTCDEPNASQAYEYLLEYVKSTGSVNGTSVIITMREVDETIYELRYDAQNDCLLACCFERTPSSTLLTFLDIKDGFYGLEYVHNSSLTSDLGGFIDPKTFNENSPMTYEFYTGPDSAKTSMLNIARTSLALLIVEMERFFDTNGLDLYVYSLGYTGMQ